MLKIAMTLNVILTACEVPKEVTPVHPVALIRYKEPKILQLTGHLHHHSLAATVVGHLGTVNLTAHPVFIIAGMRRAVHTGEQHVLSIEILILCADYKVGILLIFRCLLFALPHRFACIHRRTAIGTIFLQSHLRGVGLSIEKRTLTVLVTTQIITQRKDILW